MAQLPAGKWHFESLHSLIEAILVARDEVIHDGRKYAVCLFSRGTFLATSDKTDSQCGPRPEAECPNWKRTWKEIRTLVEQVLIDHPNVQTVYIAGGYDGADSPYHYRIGEIDPWVAVWNIPVWTRD